MIKSITIINPENETCTIDMADPSTSGFAIASITGLNPPNADISISDYSLIDGGKHNSSRVGTRNIVLTLKFMPNLQLPTIEYCRHWSYRYFPLKKKITLKILTDIRPYVIEGYVESNEAEIFSMECATQISILCPSPYFRNNSPQITGALESIPNFNFSKFTIKSSTQPIEKFAVSYENNSKILQLDSETEFDTGAVFTFNMTGNAENIVLKNDLNETIKINTAKITEHTGSALGAGDSIIVTTTPGNKRIELIRDGVNYKIFYAIDKDFDWLQIHNGHNTFTISADETESSSSDNIRYFISFNNLYQGV